jgi:hypothetical protein
MIAETALAQNAAPERSTSAPPAVSNPNDATKTSAAPVAGKNSFTEAQAKTRLESHGYTQVTSLNKDADSIWHATAMKDGKSMAVAVDYQGNITEQ